MTEEEREGEKKGVRVYSYTGSDLTRPCAYRLACETISCVAWADFSTQLGETGVKIEFAL